MSLLEEMAEFIKDAEKQVAEAEQGIRILKAADEDTTKMEKDLKFSKEKLKKFRDAILKETKTKA